MSFLEEFERDYVGKLCKRSESFRKLFIAMEEKIKAGHKLNIIETGCLRILDNWGGDGQSSYLFDRFLHHHENCKLDIYDISPDSVAACQKMVKHANTTLHCEDSVRGLWNYTGKLDVLYLDSFDVDFKNTHPSAFHHMKELCAIMKNLRPGALVMVDDNLNNTGKGQYIYTFMKEINATVLHDAYQVLFQLPEWSSDRTSRTTNVLL